MSKRQLKWLVVIAILTMCMSVFIVVAEDDPRVAMFFIVVFWVEAWAARTLWGEAGKAKK